MAPIPKRGKVSVVIPVYRSEQSLPVLVPRLVDVLRGMGREFEIVLVDDCSPDRTWTVLQELKSEHTKTLKIARLLNNSGQHNAILCGFSLTDGDVVVTMDDDLQNPPEEVPKLVKLVDDGYDLAIGAYESKKHVPLRNLGGQYVDRLIRRIFNLPRGFQLTSFRAASRRVIENVAKMGGVYPYVTCMLFCNASNYINVAVRHDARPFGRSNYNLGRNLRLAANLIFSYSLFPIKLAALFCLIAFLFSVGYGTYTFLRALIHGIPVPGWATTIVIITFFNGLILICLVLIGIYVSRVYQHVTRTRVSYTIKELHE